MKYIFITLFLVLIVILQTAIFSRLTLFGAMPNIFLASILALAIYQKERGKAFLILTPALLLDFLIGKPVGLLTLGFWLSFSLISWLSQWWFRQNDFISLCFLSFFGALCYEAFLAGLLKFAEVLGLGSKTMFFYPFYFYAILPLTILANSFLCLILFIILKKAALIKQRL